MKRNKILSNRKIEKNESILIIGKRHLPLPDFYFCLNNKNILQACHHFEYLSKHAMGVVKQWHFGRLDSFPVHKISENKGLLFN